MGRPGGKLLTPRVGSQTPPGTELGVFSPIHHLRHITQSNGCAVAVGNDEVFIVGRLRELVVGVDCVSAGWPVDAAFGGVGIGCRDGGAQRIKAQAIRC